MPRQLPGAWENRWDYVPLNDLAVGLKHFFDHLLGTFKVLPGQLPFCEGNCILGLLLFAPATQTPSHVVLPVRTIKTLVSFPSVADLTVIMTTLSVSRHAKL